MRLIDADRALEIVRDQGIAHPNAYHLTNYATLILREAPTVDAVEVVRCKDCKYARNVRHDGVEFDDIFKCTYLNPNTAMFDIDYCRYGVRKEGE